MGASAFNLLPEGFAQMSSNAGAQVRDSQLAKRILGFTLAHEQFSVPELVPLGVAADNAGFAYRARWH